MEPFLFHHLTLPQRLPHAQEGNLNEVELALVGRLVLGAQRMRDAHGLGSSPSADTWESIRLCLSCSKDLNRRGAVDRVKLLSQFQQLGARNALIVYIRSQNAALMIHRLSGPEDVIFEVFETAAKNEDVIASTTALEWDFPGSAVAVPLAIFNDHGFQNNVATFLEQASLEATTTSASQAHKAGATMTEHRETPSPEIISSLLMAILEENGRRISTQRLRKRVRDDICWLRADRPWRRSPYWLTLRVAISRFLVMALGEEVGRLEYKILLSSLLSGFLASAHNRLQVDQRHFLQAKICRRLVKLEEERSRVQDAEVAQSIGRILERLVPEINVILGKTNRSVLSEWETFKQSSTKVINQVPKKATENDLTLPLPLSGAVLRQILVETNAMVNSRRPQWVAPTNFNLDAQTHEHLSQFADPILDSTVLEDMCLRETQFERQALGIRRYLQRALPVYRGNPEQMSLLILHVMQVWVAMDQHMVAEFPLLWDFHPVFTPEMLDVLQLASHEKMSDLQNVQDWLSRRVRRSERQNEGKPMDIFANPSPACFALRYFQESPDAQSMKALQQRIEDVAALQKEDKLEEYQQKKEEFEALTRDVHESTCLYTVDRDQRQYHNPRRCPRCTKQYRLNNLRIRIHEHFLPSDDTEAKVAVFELMPPKQFAEYRDITWLIAHRLASQDLTPARASKCALRDYSQLSEFCRGKTPLVTLASTTKSFLQTHYSTVFFPVEWEAEHEGVCLPNGLRLRYYDMASGLWPGEHHPRYRFAHHIQLQLPPKSPFRSLVNHGGFAAGGDGPSSYEVMASHPQCPAGLGQHEFVAFKMLMSGPHRRWLSILAELGSTNLNWSNESAVMLLNHLALQCGPSRWTDGSRNADSFRVAHCIFRDPTFVDSLLKQVESRLNILADVVSWRETNIMDMLITFALRTLYLVMEAHPNTDLPERAAVCVFRARDICTSWFRHLRQQIRESCVQENAQQFQQCALTAALLCRRTFVVHYDIYEWDADELEQYIESGITIQENMVTDIGALPPRILHHLVASIKLAQRLCSSVSKYIEKDSTGLREGLVHFWPEAERLAEKGSTITLDKHPGWVRCNIAESATYGHQVVHLDLLLGTLLVNGKPVGKLPQDAEYTTLLGELFGDQPLRVYQSSIPGMSSTLTWRPNGFIVHIGTDESGLIVLAKNKEMFLRLIPRSCFHDDTEQRWDLPSPLVSDRCHWLDLRLGRVYITTMKNPWNVTSWRSRWVLDIQNGTCVKERPNYKGKDRVVDPHSPLFQRIAKILEGLAPRGYLLVYQPTDITANLEVQIKNFQLMFFVNQRRLLFSPQLNLEVDPDQDAGTWYGLAQKLVCRDPQNPFRRTILVPLGGKVTTRRSGCHVVVNLARNSFYGKFVINDTLGRIDCAAEPRLIYTKALLHALTSFIIPDKLTGRTGTEESLHWLQSGACQPWTVLGREREVLEQIANLTPVREYYPAGLKVMKTDTWDDENLTCHIQHPSYRPVVEEILAHSNQLFAFTPARDLVTQEPFLLPSSGEVELNRRALVRRQIYERKMYGGESSGPADRVYLPRDRSSSADMRYSRVMEVANLIRTRPKSFATPSNLASILAKGNVIGGYSNDFCKISLSERMRTDIRECWGSLVEYVRRPGYIYDAVFLVATLRFGKQLGDDNEMIRALVAFAIFPELQTMSLPRFPCYLNFRPHTTPSLDGLTKLLLPFRNAPLDNDPAEELGTYLHPKQRRQLQLAREDYEMKSAQDCHDLATAMLKQWPCVQPSLSSLNTAKFRIDLEAAMKAILPEWERLYQNLMLSKHLDQVERALGQCRSEGKYVPPKLEADAPVTGRCRTDVIPCLRDLLAKPINEHPRSVSMAMAWTPLASIPRDDRKGNAIKTSRTTAASNARQLSTAAQEKELVEELRGIVTDLEKTKSLVRQTYAKDLLQSINALERRQAPPLAKPFLYLRDVSSSEMDVLGAFGAIRRSIESPASNGSSRQIEWLQMGGLWPAVTTVTLLEHLRSTSTAKFGSDMEQALVSLGLALTKLQRNTRLNDCVLAGDTSRFQDEEANVGHSNWKPQKNRDWLLLEIDANMLIRPGQVDVARATISPPSGSNSVLQMNMGQGKTSCIMPMVAVCLANRKNLARIVVPKALLLQTAQLFQSRLGGLLGRQICHVPFSRRTPTDRASIKSYWDIHERILKSAGVMLCLPEHNLSFMLSGQQQILDDRLDQAKPMINVQRLLRSVCRDILDESDYTLATRTQLIYPSGAQVAVDGHPHRWLVAEAILQLVESHLHGLESSFPHSIEVVRAHPGGFPFVYFVRPDVEDELLRRLVADVCRGVSDILPIQSFSRAERIAVKDFLMPGSHKLRPNTLDKVRSLSPDRPQVRQTLYLLRGLLVNRILIMTLRKRWNVQYGLRPGGDPVAVPFHAKGVPSEQSEWGHPDVAILFTCLTFYYDGLSEDQLRQALARVLKSDDPSTEYTRWTQSTDAFPASLRAWNVINIDDEVQIRDIWIAIRYQVVVIDYFLNNFVFSLHARQFQAKLQSSGWDIPSFDSPALTTGFSGTNDNRSMLPLTIQQADLPALAHTNAEVLTYLLHSRSRSCEIIRTPQGGRASEVDLLKMVRNMKVQVLIDAGAQILEMDNEMLAQTWLSVDTRQNIRAALFFDTNNKAMVITREGYKTPLLASSFADDLHDCLVYLDEAHTRGTDLKLPLDARGALTVGQGQTKDHTVQAAMRLRQLGTSQSVTFFIPPEVAQVIADQKGKLNPVIGSHDVIRWLLDNTCEGIEQLQPLYFSQGVDFCRRVQAAVDFPDYLKNQNHRDEYVAAIRQPELQTLQELYEPKKSTRYKHPNKPHPRVSTFLSELNRRRKGFQDTGRAVHASALQEVEQEREVAIQVEAVQQRKKPPRYDAYAFPGLSWDLSMFCKTGRLSTGSHAVIHLFRMLASTLTGRKHRVRPEGPAGVNLFLSFEYPRTIKPTAGKSPDNLFRPVSWVLWSELAETAVVLIPEEAEQVLRLMREGGVHKKVHLVVYASAVTRQMLPFSRLKFFSTPTLPEDWEPPSWLTCGLGLLAGRLYFDWEEYGPLCEFLGVQPEKLQLCDDVEGEADGEGYVDGQDDGDAGGNTVDGKKSFCARPLLFLHDWLAVRRAGQDLAHTPMGMLSQGKSLSADHPFFTDPPVVAPDPGLLALAALRSQRIKQTTDVHNELDEADGVDDMGANVGGDEDDDGDDEIQYEESELGSVGDSGDYDDTDKSSWTS